MKRRVWALAATGVLAGWATAQTPKSLPATNAPTPAAGKDAAPESGVMILKSAGQADRKVKVVKSTKSSDGRVVTEVKDVATGETMLVSDKSVGGKTDVATAMPKATTPNATTPKPMTPKTTTFIADVQGPPTALLPKAKPRETDPLLNGYPSKSPAAMTAAATPKPADPAEPNRLKTPFAKPSAKPAVMPSAIAPKAAPQSMPAAAAPALLPAGAVAKAGDAVRVVLPVGFVPVEFRMKDETAPFVASLQQAPRPTVRQDAATALAEGRFAYRPEVKAILAAAAMHDPAPVVRAHCISCLSNLGYNEPTYVAFLRQGTADADAGVKASSASALAKLEPKK